MGLPKKYSNGQPRVVPRCRRYLAFPHFIPQSGLPQCNADQFFRTLGASSGTQLPRAPTSGLPAIPLEDVQSTGEDSVSFVLLANLRPSVCLRILFLFPVAA